MSDRRARRVSTCGMGPKDRQSTLDRALFWLFCSIGDQVRSERSSKEIIFCPSWLWRIKQPRIRFSICGHQTSQAPEMERSVQPCRTTANVDGMSPWIVCEVRSVLIVHRFLRCYRDVRWILYPVLADIDSFEQNVETMLRNRAAEVAGGRNSAGSAEPFGFGCAFIGLLFAVLASGCQLSELPKKERKFQCQLYGKLGWANLFFFFGCRGCPC